MKILVKVKGSAYSGNYNHKGRKGHVGGSAARTLSFSSPEDCRQAIIKADTAATKKITTLEKQAKRLEEDLADAYTAYDNLNATTDLMGRVFGESAETLRGMREKIDALRDQVSSINTKISTLKAERNIRAHTLLKVENPANIEYTDNSGSQSTFSQDRVDKGMDFVNSILDYDVATAGTTQVIGGNLVFEKAMGTRAACMGNIIDLPASAETSSVIHEVGHFLEDNNPVIHSKAVEFLERRTAGSTVVSLNQLTGRTSFTTGEVAKNGNFIDPYMGKQTGWATEIVSMGLEYLYKDPIALAIKDPDYFDFMWNLLRGQ